MAQGKEIGSIGLGQDPSNIAADGLTRAQSANSSIVGVAGVGADGGIYDAAGSKISFNQAPDAKVSVFEYKDDGTIYERGMVKNSRILKKGSLLFWPTVPSNTANATYQAYSGPAILMSNPSSGASPLQITFPNGGFVDTVFSGLSVPAPADGLMQLMVWVPDFDAGVSNPAVSGFTVLMSLSNGTSVGYAFTVNSFRPGWNTLQLFNPQDVDLAYAMGQNMTTSGTPNYTGSPTITSITYRLPNAATGSVIRIGGLYSQTYVKPMVLMTFDTSNVDVFNNFQPLWKAKGLTATFRMGGANSFRDSVLGGKTFAEWGLLAVADGFAVNNGSWSRAALGSGASADLIASEVGLQANWMASKGLTYGKCLFSTAGNGISGDSLRKSMYPKFGVTLGKWGAGQRIKSIGPAGLDDRLAIPAAGFPGRTNATKTINALKKTGGILLWFAHQCETYGSEPPPDSASPSSGGGIWTEDANYFGNLLKAEQDAGNLEVVNAAQLDLILNGQL